MNNPTPKKVPYNLLSLESPNFLNHLVAPLRNTVGNIGWKKLMIEAENAELFCSFLYKSTTQFRSI